MIHFNDLPLETRLNSDSEFVKRLLSLYQLSDTQIDSLNSPQEIKVDSKDIEDIGNFLKAADKLMICGDYDADGVSATSIAYLLAQKLGIQTIGYYIPHRFNEGYGVSKDTVTLAHEKGYTDLLIVDTGVKEQASIKYALSLGMNVAVVDHHLIEEKLPNIPFLHPDFLDEYAQNMSAAGLMFLVAEHLDLVDQKILVYSAIATIADVMPLWGKNREIVKRALLTLNTKPLLNIDALWKRYNQDYTAQILAFQIIPKINAVGRMADMVNMNTMVQYLIADDKDVIRQYANQVLSVNEHRKNVGKDDFSKAKLMLKEDAVHVVNDTSFHEGLLGIVANQIVTSSDKPAFVFKELEDVYKGSARSNSISLHALISKLNPDYFSAFGGHDFAFGLSVKKDKFEDFKKDVVHAASSLEPIKKTNQVVYCDFEITKTMLDDLYTYEPFGQGFEKPSFAVDGFEVMDVQKLGTYGYKLIFKNYWLKDAVYFNQHVNPNALYKTKQIIGKLDVHPRFGLSFSIDEIVV